MSDPKYTALRILIDTQALTHFRDILQHIPAEELAQDLDWELSYLKYVVNNPKIITLNILQPFEELIDCEIENLFKLVLNQFMAEKP